MKKLNYILFSLLALLFVTSCEEPQDENPVMQTPTKFVLNNPVMQSQYIELNPTMTVKFTCSQPNYGYASATKYYAQVALSQDGFATDSTYAEVNETPYTNCSDIQVSGEELAQAINKLRGVVSEETYEDLPAAPIYVRLRAEIPGAKEASAITSNVVVLEQVKVYYSVKLPGYIFLVGNCTGWTGPEEGNAAFYEQYKLMEAEDAIGSKIYTGTFEVEAGKATFRFYRKLKGWDTVDEDGNIYSLGLIVDDNATDVAFDENGIFSSALVHGKGSLNFPDWQGGKMKMTVDLAKEGNFKVTVQVVE